MRHFILKNIYKIQKRRKKDKDEKQIEKQI
jgi:hypothetical protein